jgi:acetolactate synthase-1/2/3 large subunit
MAEMRGAEAFCRALESLGVEVVFGVPGSQNVPLFEALRRSALRTVSAASELGAAFMANGYFRASGRPGVVTTIPGPGFTYALTGIAEAQHDSAALLLVIVTPTLESNRRFQLQDLDHKALAAPVVEGAFRVEQAEAMEEVLAEAWAAATVHGPGPVLLELNADCLGEPVVGPVIQEPSRRYPNPASVEQVTERLKASKRPVLFLGQGAANASEPVQELMGALNACVLSTNSGRGAVSEAHPRCLGGDLKVSGAIDIVNEVIGASDLVLALGCKFSHNGTSGFRLSIPEEKLIHIDSSKDSLDGNYAASLSIQSDCGTFLEALASYGMDGLGGEKGGWPLAELELFKERLSKVAEAGDPSSLPRLAGGPDGGLEEFFRTLRSHLPDDAIVVTDAGLHQIATRRWLEVRTPRGLILPTDYQSMGFGIPAAIGAALAVPERKVVAIVGDGGMAMSGLELATATREGVDLTVVVFNDGHLGQIRLQQLHNYGRSYGTESAGIRFRPLAEAVGASYLGMDGSNLELLPQALENDGITLVDLALEDSHEMRKAHATGLLKATARGILPKTGWRLVKRLLRRR